MSARLSRIVLILRELEPTLRFYRDGVGLPVEIHNQAYARLRASDSIALELCEAQSESQCSTGYSPFLTFDVHDLNASIPQLIQMGAVLDGGIRYETYGTVAAVRSPDGHMVGLIERANLPDGGDTSVAAAKAAERHLNVKK